MQTSLTNEKESSGSGLKKEILTLIEANNLNLCLECGKCSAVCPMVNFYGEYVHNRGTRSVVERLCFDPEDIEDEALWYCWDCMECTFFCPSGVDFQNFMAGLRRLLVSHGYTEHAAFCGVCGAYMMPKRQLACLEKSLNGNGPVGLLYDCPKCKQDRHTTLLFNLAGARRAAGSR